MKRYKNETKWFKVTPCHTRKTLTVTTPQKNRHSDNSAGDPCFGSWCYMLLCQRMLSISENCENPLQKNDNNLNDFFLGGVSSYLRSTYWWWIKKLGDAIRCLEVKKQVWRCHSICALVKIHCTNLFCTWGQKVSATVLRTCELYIMNTSNSNRLYSANSIRDISERLLANVLGHRSPAHLFQEYLKMSGGLWKVNWDVLELDD